MGATISGIADLMQIAARVLALRAAGSSPLTAVGWPLEQTLSTDDVPRLVVDPGTTPAERWKNIAIVGGPGPQALGPWAAQASHPGQTLGAFLGLQAGAGTIVHKLYVRIADPAGAAVLAPAPAELLVPGFVGVGDDGAIELYGILKGTPATALPALLSAAGAGAQTQDVIDLLGRFTGRSPENTLWLRVFASVRLNGATPSTPTVYIRAQQAGMSDGAAMTALQRIAADLKLTLPDPAASPPAAGGGSRLGFLGLTVTVSGTIRPSLGLALPGVPAA